MRLLMVLALLLGCLVPGVAAQRDKHSSQTRESLSEKLDKNKGVIKPPAHVDPDITLPTPRTPNRMPVIPPPAPNAK